MLLTSIKVDLTALDPLVAGFVHDNGDKTCVLRLSRVRKFERDPINAVRNKDGSWTPLPYREAVAAALKMLDARNG